MFGPHTDMSGLWLNKAVHTDTLPRKLLQKLHFFVTSTLYQMRCTEYKHDAIQLHFVHNLLLPVQVVSFPLKSTA